jgi:hypothetical protein
MEQDAGQGVAYSRGHQRGVDRFSFSYSNSRPPRLLWKIGDRSNPASPIQRVYRCFRSEATLKRLKLFLNRGVEPRRSCVCNIQVFETDGSPLPISSIAESRPQQFGRYPISPPLARKKRKAISSE